MKLEVHVDTEGAGRALIDGTTRVAKRAWTRTQIFLAACVVPFIIFAVLSAIGLFLQAIGGAHHGIGLYPN